MDKLQLFNYCELDKVDYIVINDNCKRELVICAAMRGVFILTHYELPKYKKILGEDFPIGEVIPNHKTNSFAFSDGSCKNNGSVNATASFSAVIMGDQFGESIIRGICEPYEYIFADNEAPFKGIVPNKLKPIAPSNNRGELLGLIYCFIALIRGRAYGHNIIISDSKISVNTLNIWLPARIKKGTERELKNYDLICIAYRLMIELRNRSSGLELKHINSHMAAPLSNSEADVLYFNGNKKADDNAELALRDGAPPIECLNAPKFLIEMIKS